MSAVTLKTQPALLGLVALVPEGKDHRWRVLWVIMNKPSSEWKRQHGRPRDNLDWSQVKKLLTYIGLRVA